LLVILYGFHFGIKASVLFKKQQKLGGQHNQPIPGMQQTTAPQESDAKLHPSPEDLLAARWTLSTGLSLP
jgi:hypothetical protein